jgi:hypothetical protein
MLAVDGIPEGGCFAEPVLSPAKYSQRYALRR